MKGGMLRLVAGLVALAGGAWGLVNPAVAQVASSTIAGWALVIVGLLQGRAALRQAALRERAGAVMLAVSGLFLGLSLLLGPFGDGTLLRWILGLLLLVSAAGKLWIGRRARTDRMFVAVLGAGCVSALLGLIVLGGGTPALGTVLSVELLAAGVTLIVMALRPERTA